MPRKPRLAKWRKPRRHCWCKSVSAIARTLSMSPDTAHRLSRQENFPEKDDPEKGWKTQTLVAYLQSREAEPERRGEKPASNTVDVLGRDWLNEKRKWSAKNEALEYAREASKTMDVESVILAFRQLAQDIRTRFANAPPRLALLCANQEAPRIQATLEAEFAGAFRDIEAAAENIRIPTRLTDEVVAELAEIEIPESDIQEEEQ
jgi:hypothetical protein